MSKSPYPNAGAPLPSLRSGPITSVREKARPWWIAALILAAIIYGSLIPFRFDPTRISTGLFLAQTLALRETSLEDVSVNFALYAALGGALLGIGSRQKHRCFAVVGFCAALSLALETLQIALPQRVSSGTDILVDVVGAVCGVATFCLWSAKRYAVLAAAAQSWRLQPLGFLASAISCGVLIYDLLPFDFLTSTAQLHAAFQRIHPVEFPSDLPAITAEFAHALVFLVLGFLIAVDSIRSGVSRLNALVLGLRHGLVLACLIEALQLFTNSHVAEPGCLITRTAGSLLGAWTAIFLTHPPQVRDLPLGSAMAVRVFLFAAAILQFFTIGLGLSVGHRVTGGGGGWVLPFYGLWMQPAPLAAAKLLSCLITAAILSATMTALLRQLAFGHYRALACLMISTFYFACEGIRVGLTRAPLDATNVILASLACLWVLRQEHRLFCPRPTALIPSRAWYDEVSF